MSKKYSITHFFFVGLLINLFAPVNWAQDTLSSPRKDRIYRVSNALDAPVYYSCADSIYADFESNLVTLFGSAEVKYETITMTADKIEMDLKKKEVYAVYTYDADSNRVGIPKFTDQSESFTAASIRYNFDTEKGYIEELKTQQDEMYLHMGVAKRHQNEEVHFTQGKFTTCELDDPHFHFQLSKAVMVPDKRIATGPMNLHVKGIPTPLGLPFSVIPTKERETHGWMFPMITPVSEYGFGIQELGYYFPIKKSELIQTTLYGTAFSNGSFEIKNQTDYKKRYKYDGILEMRYGSYKRKFPNDTNRTQKIAIQWTHRQEPGANPYWQFNSKVNFQSDNTGQTNLDPLSDQVFQNNFNSDINLVRKFPGKPVTIGLKAGLKQNSALKSIDADLPTFNVNVNRFFPFKGLNNGVGKERFYEKIGLRYSLEAKNRSRFADSLLSNRDFNQIQNQFQNGIRQDITMNYPLQLFKNIVTLNTSARYNHRTNFQYEQKRYDATSDSVITDTINGAGFSHDFSMNANLSTNLYAYYSFIGSKELKMRHVMTPQIGFSYSPDMSSYVEDSLGPNDIEVSYSPYQNSLYREGNGRDQGVITFSLNNSFELKHPNRKDTSEEFSKKRIIQALKINGSYDIFKDSMKLSDISINLRMNPFGGFSTVYTASISPYAWDDVGRTLNSYAVSNGQGLGRVSRINISNTYTFASKKSKDKIDKNQEAMSNRWGSDFEYYSMNPHDIIDFDIPWKINIQHNWSFTSNNDTLSYNERRFNQRQTVILSGDFSFTKRWKIGYRSSYDVENAKLTQARISLNRDMHCWQLAFYWTPAGPQQSFMVRFNATSSLFQSAKLELRKPPEFL